MLTILTLSQVPTHMGSPLLHTHTHRQSYTLPRLRPVSHILHGSLPPTGTGAGRSPHSQVSALTLTPPPHSEHTFLLLQPDNQPQGEAWRKARHSGGQAAGPTLGCLSPALLPVSGMV